MEDNQIIELYWNRNEKAISETDKKYGKYCNYIAYNILQNSEDAKECINETYLKTWNSIPPQRPKVFKLFIAKITRNLAIDIYRKNKHKSVMEDILDELSECTSSGRCIGSRRRAFYACLCIKAADWLWGCPAARCAWTLSAA